MKKKTLRKEMIKNASKYIIINDGQYIYPILSSDLRKGDTEEIISAMNGDEYSLWCSQSVPADLRYADIGTAEIIDLCNDLIKFGANKWYVA